MLAFIATWICWKKMGTSWRMGIDPNDKTQLVVTGPYARLRHPIYALSSLLMICTMLILPSPAMLAVGAVHLSLLQWEARREERYLTALHGPSYVQYSARTGRFLPKF
jgi:protein-S-isoprenylcysteine O-methyltransferase Ste14